jgi:hypothetical protein
MCLILKDGILPIPGGLRKYGRRCAGFRLAPADPASGFSGRPEKDRNLNSDTASIPSRMFLSLKDGNLPIPGGLQKIEAVRVLKAGCPINRMWTGRWID